MKEKLNKLMKKFEEDCKNDPEYSTIPLTFDNFVKWLDGRTWEMERYR